MIYVTNCSRNFDYSSDLRHTRTKVKCNMFIFNSLSAGGTCVVANIHCKNIILTYTIIFIGRILKTECNIT